MCHRSFRGRAIHAGRHADAGLAARDAAGVTSSGIGVVPAILFEPMQFHAAKVRALEHLPGFVDSWPILTTGFDGAILKWDHYSGLGGCTKHGTCADLRPRHDVRRSVYGPRSKRRTQ